MRSSRLFFFRASPATVHIPVCEPTDALLQQIQQYEIVVGRAVNAVKTKLGIDEYQQNNTTSCLSVGAVFLLLYLISHPFGSRLTACVARSTGLDGKQIASILSISHTTLYSYASPNHATLKRDGRMPGQYGKSTPSPKDLS